MKIVGCDLHTRYQQVAMLDTEAGELSERHLEHANGEARAFYSALKAAVRVGIEATGHTRWFERMLAELGHELWIGDAARLGVHELVIQRILRHTNVSTTASYYIKSTADDVRNAMAKLEHQITVTSSQTQSDTNGTLAAHQTLHPSAIQ